MVQNEGSVVDSTMKSQLSCYRLTLLKRVVAFILTLLVSLTLDLDQSRREKHLFQKHRTWPWLLRAQQYNEK